MKSFGKPELLLPKVAFVNAGLLPRALHDLIGSMFIPSTRSLSQLSLLVFCVVFTLQANLSAQETLQSTQGQEPIVIESNDESHRPELSGQKLTVAGDGNTVLVLGECSVLVVTGDKNVISVKAVDRIVITGTGNTVKWSSGIKNDIPKVVDEGKDNQVSSGKISED